MFKSQDVALWCMQLLRFRSQNHRPNDDPVRQTESHDQTAKA